MKYLFTLLWRQSQFDSFSPCLSKYVDFSFHVHLSVPHSHFPCVLESCIFTLLCIYFVMYSATSRLPVKENEIWNLTWNQISNQIWNHLQRWFQIWYLKMWPSLNAAIWSTHPSHILNCPKRHLLHNPCATDVIIECENCMIYYISIFTAVEMASNIQWTLDKNFGWFPNRPTWEM